MSFGRVSSEEEYAVTAGKEKKRPCSDDATRGRPKQKRRSASHFFDEYAAVATDHEEEEEDQAEDDFIDPASVLPVEEDARIHRHSLLPLEEDREDIDEMERRLEERYHSRHYHLDYDVHPSQLEQQALLPSVRDPKLWVLKCEIGREREVALRLMHNSIHKASQLQIRSAIAIDHLKNYIYIEADKEAHVREACKGIRSIYPAQIMLVPIKEMNDVLSLQTKVIDLSRDTWVGLKTGTYKGDLAKVVDVDDVRQRVTIKLIPRVDLQALAAKMVRTFQGRRLLFPPPRLLNTDEARGLHLRVERKKDAISGDYFDCIGGMMFKDGFLYKNVSMKSVSTHNIQPSFDELEKFRQPSEDGHINMANLSTLSTNRKKCHFVKGDPVIVSKGDLKNMKGWVEKVGEDSVHIKPMEKGLPKTLVIAESELCKFFEPGCQVKVVSGISKGATGMVMSVEGHVVILVSDTTKETHRIFADNVVQSSEVTSDVTRVGGRPNGHKNEKCLSRFAQPRTPLLDTSLSTIPPGERPPMHSGGRHRGGRGHDALIGAVVKVRVGQYKGYNGRVIDVKGRMVRLELESQMKVVTVERQSISENVNVSTPFGETSPMHPSQTSQPFMTPMRDLGGV